jgi:hypothetical protein
MVLRHRYCLTGSSLGLDLPVRIHLQIYPTLVRGHLDRLRQTPV